jgi:hypothetical protein
MTRYADEVSNAGQPHKGISVDRDFEPEYLREAVVSQPPPDLVHVEGTSLQWPVFNEPQGLFHPTSDSARTKAHFSWCKRNPPTQRDNYTFYGGL